MSNQRQVRSLSNDRLGFVLIFGLFVAAAALVLFAWLADEVLEGDVQQFDDSMRRAGHAYASADITWAMQTITMLGSVPVMVAFGFVVGFGLIQSKQRRAALFPAVTMLGSILLNMVLKWSFRRPRPPPFFNTPLPGSYSFPSGHALSAFCFYGVVAAMLAARARNHTTRIIVWAVAGILIGLIGLSRIYLGVHHPSDVAAGYAVALIWVTVVQLADRVFAKRGRVNRDAKS